MNTELDYFKTLYIIASLFFPVEGLRQAAVVCILRYLEFGCMEM